MERKRLLRLIGKRVGGVFAQLNGTSHFFSVTHAAFPNTGLTGAQDMTIYAWAKLNSSEPSTVIIMSKFESAGNNRMFNCKLDTTTMYFAVSSTGAGIDTTQGTQAAVFSDDAWHHVAFVYDAGAGTVDFYRDGVLLGQAGSLKNTIADKAPDFLIGAEEGFQHFDGSLAYVHLFNAIKIPSEIYAASVNFHFDHSVDGDLVCGYRFDEEAAAILIDNIEGTAGGDLELNGGDTTNYGTHTRAVGILP